MPNPDEDPNSSLPSILPPVGVILAGGASRRMGRDKRQLKLPDHFFARFASACTFNEPLVEEIAGLRGFDLLQWGIWRLRAVCSQVLVAGGRPVPDCDRDSLQHVLDADGKGPMAGILGAAAAAPKRDLLVVATDQPLVRVSTLRHLVEVRKQTVINGAPEQTVALWGNDRWQPLLAIYGAEAIEVLQTEAAAGRYALYRALRNGCLAVRRVALQDLESQLRYPATGGESLDELYNINTPPQFRQL